MFRRPFVRPFVAALRRARRPPDRRRRGPPPLRPRRRRPRRRAAPETRPPIRRRPADPRRAIEALDQQLRILARQIEIEKEAATAAQATAPVAVAGAGGFELRSADSAFRLRIRGYLHADSRYYGDDDDNRGIDTFLLRRARPIVEATFFKIFDFRIMSDFGGGTAVVQDAYFDARFAKVFNLRAGKQKPPLGQERLLSATDILFIERALPTALVPNRDVGVQAYGDLAPWLTYQLGVFNGVIDGGSGDVDTADSKDVVGRLVFSPFKAGATSACRRCPSASAAAAATKSARSRRRRWPSSAAAGSWCGSAIAPTAPRRTRRSPTAGARGSRRTASTTWASSGCRPNTWCRDRRSAAPRPPTRSSSSPGSRPVRGC